MTNFNFPDKSSWKISESILQGSNSILYTVFISDSKYVAVKRNTENGVFYVMKNNAGNFVCDDEGAWWPDETNEKEIIDFVERTITALKVGDVCIYSFGGKNKSKATVQIVKLFDYKPAAEIKFLEVEIDDTGNGFFEYLLRSGGTMNASLKYLTKKEDADV